ARANYLPRIAIGGVAGYTASEFDALGNSGTPRYVVGPVISWPLFDIGRVKTGVDEARAQQREAAAQHQQTVLQAQEEVRTSLDAFHRARELLHHLEEAAAASERATDLARLRFEEGGADFLEVLDAESRQLAAQDRLAAGRTEARAWLVAVNRSVGAMVLPERRACSVRHLHGCYGGGCMERQIASAPRPDFHASQARCPHDATARAPRLTASARTRL